MKKKILWAALLTLFVFPLIGWGLLYFFRDFPGEVIFRSDFSIYLQILIGIALGVLLGIGARELVSRPFLDKTGIKFARIIVNLRLTEAEIIFISLCAGFGEELLFRGAIQPLLGIWPTAIIFVAIHGYLNPRDWRISVYGIYMTLAIAGLGYITDLVGIFGACIAHAAIDYVLFKYLITKGNENPFIATIHEEAFPNEAKFAGVDPEKVETKNDSNDEDNAKNGAEPARNSDPHGL